MTGLNRVTDFGLNSASLADMAYDVKSPKYGAKGDGNNDDTTAIQNALNDAYSAGGGIVYIPNGHYKITAPLRVKDNVTLMGQGYGSWIDNVTPTGYNRMPIMTGNIDGSMSNMFSEPQYPIQPITAGTKTVTFVNTADVNNFLVGDMVFIQSVEKWTASGQDAKTAQYMNMNIILSISGTTLNLKYPIPDNYSTANPVIAKFSGTQNGIDGVPNWMAKNVTVKNLRLTHQLGLTSGWYGIYAHGFECHFEKLWLTVSTPFGSNGLAYSVIKDIYATFDGCASDLCDWQCNNIVDNVKLYRIGINTNIGQSSQGFGFHDGMDNTLKNSEIDLANSGGLNCSYTQRTKFINTKIYHPNDANNKASVTGSQGTGFHCEGLTIINGNYHGIYLQGNKGIIKNNTIRNMNYTAGYYGIFLKAGIGNMVVDGNIIGDDATRTSQDIVTQQTNFQSTNFIKNNVTYNIQAPQVDKTFAQTSSTTETTMKSYTVRASSNKKATSYRVLVAGYRTGATDAKTINLKLGSTILAQVTYAVADTQQFFIEAYISHNDNDPSVRAEGSAWKSTTCVYKNHQSITNALSSDSTLTLTAFVNNSADSVVVETFLVDVIQ